MIEYSTEFDPDEKFPLEEDGYDLDLCDYAVEAAKDFFYSQDGWESSWPIEFNIFKDGKEQGSFVISLETDVNFYVETNIP